jgi:hypothetical protein
VIFVALAKAPEEEAVVAVLFHSFVHQRRIGVSAVAGYHLETLHPEALLLLQRQKPLQARVATTPMRNLKMTRKPRWMMTKRQRQIMRQVLPPQVPQAALLPPALKLKFAFA